MNYKTRFRFFFAGMILFQLAANFAHPVTPTIIQDLALPDYMFGLMLAAMQLSNFLFSPFWGKMNGSISSRQTLLICCMGYGVAQLGFACATTQAMILLVRVLAGVFVGGVFVSFLTYVINTAKPEDQAKYLTYSATIQAVCGAFGYLVGGVLGEFSIRGTFFLQAFSLGLAGILFRLVCLPDGPPKQVPLKQVMQEANPLQAFLDGKYFMNLAFLMLFAVNILMNFANTGFDQVFNYYLKDQLGLTSSYNGGSWTDLLCVQYDPLPVDHSQDGYETFHHSSYGLVRPGGCGHGGDPSDLAVYRTERVCLCRVLCEPAGTAAHGGHTGRPCPKESGDGLLQCNQIPGQHRWFPHGRFPVCPACEAALCCGGGGLWLQPVCGGGVSGAV